MDFLSSFREKRGEAALRSWTNIRSWHTDRRLLVIESDDWGSIRMPNRNTLEVLVAKGLKLDNFSYDKYDCLESRSDLVCLFDILAKHRDYLGNSPVFTFNTVMGNPDFDAIRKSGFECFCHESLFESYEHYQDDDLRGIWRQAVEESLIRPQFHGREHLNVELWLRDLRLGHRETSLAFDHDYFGLTTQTSSKIQRNYLAACWPDSRDHLTQIEARLIEGLEMFRQTFGYASRSIIPCNYILPRQLEKSLSAEGVGLIQGQRGQRLPSSDGERVMIRRCRTGQKNDHGQFYSVRNCKFEPFGDESRDWVVSTLAEIGNAFVFRAPAIVSTHRVNFVGGMDVGHRDRNLSLLDKLLSSVLHKWPDVEFVASDQLLSILES